MPVRQGLNPHKNLCGTLRLIRLSRSPGGRRSPGGVLTADLQTPFGKSCGGQVTPRDLATLASQRTRALSSCTILSRSLRFKSVSAGQQPAQRRVHPIKAAPRPASTGCYQSVEMPPAPCLDSVRPARWSPVRPYSAFQCSGEA